MYLYSKALFLKMIHLNLQLGTLSIFLFFLFLLGCSENPNDRIGEGKIDEKQIFTNDRFGWTMEIPDGWRVMSKIEKDVWAAYGKHLSKKEFGDRYEDNWMEILQLTKGPKINQMYVFYNKFDPAKHDMSYTLSRETRFKGIKDILEKNKGTRVDVLRTETTIDSVQFNTCNMTLYKKDELRGYQVILEKKYQNHDILMISLTVEEKEAFWELQDAIMASSFSRKN